MLMNAIAVPVHIYPRWRSHPTRRQGRDRAHTQQSAYMTMDPGTRMRPRLHPWMGVVVTDSGDGDDMLDALLDFSTQPTQTQTRATSTAASCLEYECKHNSDDIDRPWGLNGTRTVTFTIFLYIRRKVVVSTHEKEMRGKGSRRMNKTCRG